MSNTAPFLHIAYANNNTGTLDFTTTGGIERDYTGFYTDEYATDSSDPTKYKWLTNAEFKNKVNTAAYANSADGTDGFTTVYPNLNLLDGTKDFSGTWSNSNSWLTDGTYKGLTVKKRTGQWYGIYKPFTAPNDGIYTFSAYIKTSGNSANVYRYGTLNSTAYNIVEKSMGNNFDWTRDIVTLNLKANDSVWIRYKMEGSGTDSILWVAGYKWEEGSVATPYMPSVTEVKDSDYPQYIGLPNVINPTTFKDYEWTLLESIPKKILNTHVAYANSSDGVTDFTTVYPNLNLLTNTAFKNYTPITQQYLSMVVKEGGVNNKPYVSVSYNNPTPNSYADAPVWTVNKAYLKPATTYTFSFYLRGNGTVRTHITPSLIDTSSANGLADGKVITPAGDGAYDWNLTSEWVRHTYTFITKSSITDNKLFIFRIFTGKSVDVCLPKLEEGSIATPWLPSDSEVQPSDYPKFVGVYGDDSTIASQSPTVYKWSSISVPGPTPPTVADNLYVFTMPTVKNINLTYGIGTLVTKPMSWLSAKPKLDANQVLWYKSEITGTDNSVGVYYSNLVGGSNLDDGDAPLDNTVVSIVLNNKTINVPRDLALKLELLSQTSNKRDNELAQLIADTNDRITNIDINIDNADLISLPAFQSLQNQANKINDDLNNHGLNVKDFGAVGNGQADDSNAIQAAFDYAKTKTLSAKPALKTQYTVVIPGGVYKASNLTMSTVIKLKPLGTVVIQPVASTDTVLTIAQDNAAKDYVFNFPSQQYLRGNLIDGSSGTIYLKGTSKKGSYTGTGLVLGSTTGLGDTNPLGRYRLTGLSISNFDTLVKINTKDNYLGCFMGCHFEGGNTGVRFGDDTNNVSINSGENFEFSHCVIASCTTVGVKINSPVDANFTNSSFDFNATAIELNSTIINVNILGGHFEGNDVVVKSDYPSDQWYYNQPKVNLFGTVILDPAVDPIFKGVMLLSMKSANITVQQQKLGSYGGLCDYSVNVMGDPDTYYQNGYSTVVSRNLCQLYNADFHDGFKGMTWTDTNGTATFEYLTSGLPNGGDFTKGLHIKLENEGTGYIDFTKIRVSAGQILSMGLYAYLNSTASGGVGPFSLVAYDANDNKLTEITDSIQISDFKATTWAWIFSRQLIVPEQAEYVVPRMYFNGALELYTSQLYTGKV